MSLKVFLSLSYVDRDFVSQVRSQLPKGLAYFYEESFENGESLIAAMERAVSDSAVFALFASQEALKSTWVNFEIDQARLAHLQNQKHRILIFPTDPNVKVTDFPVWLRAHWIPRAGMLPADIARYITTVLLEPNYGLSSAAPRIIGRGKAIDDLQQLVAEKITRTKASPNVFFLFGFRGIGRRTFASYFMRTAMSADANLPYGPSIILSPQSDLADVHSALRNELSPMIDAAAALREAEAFAKLNLADQIKEVVRLLSHYADLGQAVALASAGGFFEDNGDPKNWLLPLLSAIPPALKLFLISNRQLPPVAADRMPNIVQVRVNELDEKDVRTLMTFTAERLGLSDFSISDQLVRAIGGHADVANAAVRLVSIKGRHILERDPRQLFNIQNAILGENIEGGALTDLQRKILMLLSWVPHLNAELLERILVSDGAATDQIIEAIENLMAGCLLIVSGSTYTISPAIRIMFRRFNLTPPRLLKLFAQELSNEWNKARENGLFRIDLFESFVFMIALEGKTLPKELLPLLTSGTLFEVVRDTYARGKDEADKEALEKVITWGLVAEDMLMSEAAREDILSVVARAQIRLGQFGEADKTLEFMRSKHYRSVPFLLGHSLRRQGKFEKAIEFLVEAVRDDRKFNRSAVHELALAYKKSSRLNDLRKLLADYGGLIADSALFADFQIGIDLARSDLVAAEAGIERLRLLPDDDGKSDIRFAQLLMRRRQYMGAKDLLNMLLENTQGNRLRLRSLRATCAAYDRDFDLARRDIEFIRNFPSWQNVAVRLEATLLVEQNQPIAARKIIDGLSQKSAEDLILYARALDVQADLPETTIPERQELHTQATKLREQNNFALEYDYGD